MTRRAPTAPPDLADTLDEASPRDRSGSFRREPSGIREPYFDAGPDDPSAPENVDIADRLTLLEQHRRADVDRIAEAHQLAEKSGTWNRRIFKALVALTSVAFAALMFAFSVARSGGVAAGEKAARDIERARYIAIIDQLVRDVARHDGILGSLVDALRSRYPIGSLPLVGPPARNQVSDP